MMVAGFRGTLYRSYELPPPLASHHECAMCEQQDPAVVGRILRGWFPSFAGPCDPGHQTNDGQFTSNREKLLKTRIKMSEGSKRKRERERVERPFRLVPSELFRYTRGFYFIPKTITGVKRADRVLGLALLLLSSCPWMRWSHYFYRYASTVALNCRLFLYLHLSELPLSIIIDDNLTVYSSVGFICRVSSSIRFF